MHAIVAAFARPDSKRSGIELLPMLATANLNENATTAYNTR